MVTVRPTAATIFHRMGRWLVALALFVVSSTSVVGLMLYRAYRSVSEEHATGFAFVLGSPAENVFRVLVLILLAVGAYWASGRLVSH